MIPQPQNLQIFSQSDAFLQTLKEFHIIQEGHFEYKGKAMDATRMHGEFFVNFRLLTTNQEVQLSEYYRTAISEWFGNKKNMVIVGMAMASLFLPKVIQMSIYADTGIEFAYTEKREGVLGLYGEQAEKCRGKHILFIEDACNNGTSSREIIHEIKSKTESFGITGFSILYGVHRGHTFLTEPAGDMYAMSMIHAPAYHYSECPACETGDIPLLKYKSK